MTDKEKIKEEIERQKSFCKKTFDVLYPDDLDAAIAYAHIELLDRLLQFIDSLPEESTDEANCITKSEDLEEAADKYAENHGFRVPYDGSNKFYDDVDVKASKEGFIAGAEWQKEKMNLRLQTEYEKGLFDLNKAMMKDAVELHIVESFNPVGTENEKPHGFTALCYNAKYPDFYPITGQTIKVIPFKEIQKMSKIAEQKALEAYPPHYQKLAGDGYFDMSLEKREGYIRGYDQAMQDFLEKAEEFLYLQLNNGSIECGNIEKLIEQFKNYMQDESKN